MKILVTGGAGYIGSLCVEPTYVKVIVGWQSNNPNGYNRGLI